jgi:hypothetical protein
MALTINLTNCTAVDYLDNFSLTSGNTYYFDSIRNISFVKVTSTIGYAFDSSGTRIAYESSRPSAGDTLTFEPEYVAIQFIEGEYHA